MNTEAIERLIKALGNGIYSVVVLTIVLFALVVLLAIAFVVCEVYGC